MFDARHVVHAAGAAAPLHRQSAGDWCRSVATGGAPRLDRLAGAGRYRPVAPAVLVRGRPRAVRVRRGGGAEAAAGHADQGVRTAGFPHLHSARTGRGAAGGGTGAGLHTLVVEHAVAGLGAGRFDCAGHHGTGHRALPAQPAAADPLAVDAAGAALHRRRVPAALPHHRTVLRRGQPDAHAGHGPGPDAPAVRGDPGRGDRRHRRCLAHLRAEAADRTAADGHPAAGHRRLLRPEPHQPGPAARLLHQPVPGLGRCRHVHGPADHARHFRRAETGRRPHDHLPGHPVDHPDPGWPGRFGGAGHLPAASRAAVFQRHHQPAGPGRPRGRAAPAHPAADLRRADHRPGAAQRTRNRAAGDHGPPRGQCARLQ